MAQYRCYFSPKHPVPNQKSDVALALPVVKGKFPFARCVREFCYCSNGCKKEFAIY